MTTEANPLEALTRVAAAAVPPEGFVKIEGDIFCRCIRMWRGPDGSRWCCNPKVTVGLDGDGRMTGPTNEESKVVELITAPEQAAALKEKLEHALHDVCAVLDQIDAAGLHGSFQLGKGQYWNVASMVVAKHF